MDDGKGVNQNISISSIAGPVNVAGRDVVQCNNNIGSDPRAQIQSLLSRIADTLNEDESLDIETKQDAVEDTKCLQYELQKSQPREQRVRDYLGCLAKVASVASFVTQLAHLLGY